MEWYALGAISYVLFLLWKRVDKLERRQKSVDVLPIPPREELLTPVDIAARAVDRHEQAFHKREL